MKELSIKNEHFMGKWKVCRSRKFFYGFLHGTVYRGLPVGIFLFFVDSHFKTENMHLSGFIISLTFCGIVGLFFGLNLFERNDKKYRNLLEDEKILKGIKLLETDKTWNFENLVIHEQDDETLVVKNKLFWLDESDALSKNLDACLNLVMKDFERLKENADFDVFSGNYKVRVQVYNNSEKETPLIEVTM